MQSVFSALIVYVVSHLRSHQSLRLENMALRHHLAVYQHTVKRPKLRPDDRLFWSWLARLWSGWQEALVFVQPCTVIAWQKRRFRDSWRQRSQSSRAGRPRGRKPSSPTWKALLKHHVTDIVACDCFTVPTASCKVLFVFILLAHERRRIMHCNITEHPTAPWTSQHIVEAFPWETAPRSLLRDRDAISSVAFQHRIKNIGIEEVKIAPRSPWHNPYCERLSGSIRREVLDQVIVLNDWHLRRVLTAYISYDHRFRTHLSLDMDCPTPALSSPLKPAG